MTDGNNKEPLSSEELLRRARDELVRPSTPVDPTSPEPAPAEPAAAEPGVADAKPDAPDRPAPDSEMPRAEAPTPESGQPPLIPADFQPAASRGRPVPPPETEAGPVAPEGGPIATPQPGLGSQLWARRGWIVGGLFLAILAFSYFTGATSVEDLSVGDCFKDPGTESISEVDTVDCTEPHGYEMFATVILVGDNGSWPGDFELFEEAYDACLEPFLTYTGLSLDDTGYMWEYTPFIPLQESWAEGGRDALCTLYQVDAELNPVPATTSARAGG